VTILREVEWKKKKEMNIQDSSAEKLAVINDCYSTENDKSLLTVNNESNLSTLFSFQSLLLCLIIIHCSSDSSYLMNLSFFFSQCF